MVSVPVLLRPVAGSKISIHCDQEGSDDEDESCHKEYQPPPWEPGSRRLVLRFNSRHSCTPCDLRNLTTAMAKSIKASVLSVQSDSGAVSGQRFLTLLIALRLG